MSIKTDPYRLESVPLFEALYGKNLISLGGLAAIDNMFSGVAITGLKALDFGFGLGGVAFYLAEKYQMQVSGIEIQAWMVKYAEEHAPPNISQQLDFHVYHSDDALPFKPQTFDLVFSKGVLNHVHHKTNLFQQIYSIIKPEGIFVIADWIYPEVSRDEAEPLVCESKESYQQVLENAGFKTIEFRDDSAVFLGYTSQLLERLTANRQFIEVNFGAETFSMIWQNQTELLNKIKGGNKIAIRIVAKK